MNETIYTIEPIGFVRSGLTRLEDAPMQGDEGAPEAWLMVSPVSTAGNVGTRLYFGSAVVPKRNPKTGELSLGFLYQGLLGFHKIYSILLLYSAKLRLEHRKTSS